MAAIPCIVGFQSASFRRKLRGRCRDKSKAARMAAIPCIAGFQLALICCRVRGRSRDKSKAARMAAIFPYRRLPAGPDLLQTSRPLQKQEQGRQDGGDTLYRRLPAGLALTGYLSVKIINDANHFLLDTANSSGYTRWAMYVGYHRRGSLSASTRHNCDLALEAPGRSPDRVTLYPARSFTKLGEGVPPSQRAPVAANCGISQRGALALLIPRNPFPCTLFHKMGEGGGGSKERPKPTVTPLRSFSASALTDAADAPKMAGREIP